MKINLTQGAKKIKAKELELMKLGVYYDERDNENQLILKTPENIIILQNFENGSGVCPLIKDESDDILFFGYIDDMDITNIQMRQ